MNVLRFQARDSADAIRQIRSQLGEEAVVLSVTPVPARGFGKLLGRKGLEVLAGVPEQVQSLESEAQSPVSELRRAKGEGRRATRREQEQWQRADGTEGAENQAGLESNARDGDLPSPNSSGFESGDETFPPLDQSRVVRFTAEALDYARPFRRGSEAPGPETRNTLEEGCRFDAAKTWRTEGVLEQMGLLPVCVERVMERARRAFGEQPPAALAEELALVKEVLGELWPKVPTVGKGFPAIHVFIGPPGSGKTTALCKWLAKSVLVEQQRPRAWRLDGQTAHFAGLLDFYGEILNVPVEREWQGVPSVAGFDLGFVDLPGTNPQDALGLQQLRTRLQAIPSAQVHLVLNAAYEVPVLLGQVRAFAGLPPSDLILTHLDEEKRRGKLWNLVLGTNLPVRFLSGGQNIPGDFAAASPEALFGR